MPASVLEPFCATLPLVVPCGDREHEVVIQVTPWGRVRILSNPCELLPPLVRQFTGSTCAERLPSHLRLVSQCLQYVWLEEIPVAVEQRLPTSLVFRELKTYVDRVRRERRKMAKRLLAIDLGDRRCIGGEDLSQSLREAQLWAQFVSSRFDPDLARDFARTYTSWPAGISVAALCSTPISGEAWQTDLLAQAVADSLVLDELRSRFAAQLRRFGEARHARMLVRALPVRTKRVGQHASDALLGIFRRLLDSADRSSDELQQALAETLETGYDECPDATVRCLARLGTPLLPHMRPLIAQDTSAAILGAWVLAQLQDLRALEVLVSALLKSHSRFREAATRAIIALSPLIIEAGDRHLSHVASFIRHGCAPAAVVGCSMLLQIDSASAAQTLGELCRSEGRTAVQIAALETLGRMNHPQAVSSVLEIYESGCCERPIVEDSLISLVARLAADPNRCEEMLQILEAGPTSQQPAHHRSRKAISIDLLHSEVADIVEGSEEDVRAALKQALTNIVSFPGTYRFFRSFSRD